jgi:hypothetical protein
MVVEATATGTETSNGDSVSRAAAASVAGPPID